MAPDKSIQDTFWPDGICFGCGPRNDRGLQLKSWAEGEEVMGSWTPASHHQAFPGILNGGIVGTLLDCHSAATAWWALSDEGQLEGPNLLTAEYAIKLLRPTPTDRALRLAAHPVEIEGRKVRVAARIEVDGATTATCEGLFVQPRSQLGQ